MFDGMTFDRESDAESYISGQTSQYDPGDYDIIPRYTVKYQSSDNNGDKYSVYSHGVPVMNKSAWLRGQELTGVQDEDYEYDQYLFEQWDRSDDADYLNQLNTVMTSHRNAWNDKHEYWEARRQGIRYESKVQYADTTTSATRSDTTDKTMSGEVTTLSSQPTGLTFTTGLTQVEDKVL
jgi:hypothetical protein